MWTKDIPALVEPYVEDVLIDMVDEHGDEWEEMSKDQKKELRRKVKLISMSMIKKWRHQS